MKEVIGHTANWTQYRDECNAHHRSYNMQINFKTYFHQNIQYNFSEAAESRTELGSA